MKLLSSAHHLCPLDSCEILLELVAFDVEVPGSHGLYLRCFFTC